MNGFFESLLQNDYGSTSVTPEMMLLILLLAFCLGHIIGWVYMATHTGLSYSQMFVASLVVIAPITGLVMVLLAGDIVIAFGLLGVFAIVRFRNVLKDTRDAMFVLWAMVEGIACGTRQFSTALIGAATVGLIFLYLRLISFGGRHRYDVIVSLHTAGDAGLLNMRQVLRRHAIKQILASQRDLPDQERDLSYRLLLRDPNRSGELLAELERTPGVAHVSLYNREDESEM